MNGTDADAAGFENSPVLKALSLLSHVAHCDAPVMLADLSRALQIPKPTCYRLALMLERTGYVRKDPISRRYAIGPRFEELALSGLRNGGAGGGRRRLMDALAKRVGARVNFVVMRGGELLTVAWVESSSVIRVDISPELQVPIQCSASGKLLLAHAKEDVRERFLRSGPFRANTRNSITSSRALEREFARIRKQGFSEDHEELIYGVNCLAVPVCDAQGDVVAGLAVMAPVAVLTLAVARTFLPDLRSCADAIAVEMRSAEPAGSDAKPARPAVRKRKSRS